MEDSSDRKDRLPVLFSADSADSNKPQSIEIVAARAIENKRKLIDLRDRWIPHPRHEHHGHSAVDGRDPSVVNVEKLAGATTSLASDPSGKVF